MSARSAHSRFWLVTVAAALTAAGTASLGVWQLGRAQQKTDLHAAIAARSALPPLSTADLAALTPPVADALYRSVAIEGRWVQGTTLFLDNRPMNGRTGFIVLSALRLEGSDQAVLVQRGWVPRDFLDRERLPAVHTPDGPVSVPGRLAPPPSQLFEPGPGIPGLIRQNVDVTQLASEWRVPLRPGVSVLQTGGELPAGWQRDWPRFVGDHHKHLAYAAQWFAMSAIAVGLYLWFQLLLPRLQRRSHGQNP